MDSGDITASASAVMSPVVHEAHAVVHARFLRHLLVPGSTVSPTECAQTLDHVLKAPLMRIALAVATQQDIPVLIRNLMLH